ncbi:MAG: glycosyltransferase family 2 protein [Deltaproteobacteria bacterium]|nr:glycosyltransferase family 2 protein [Deltaproteobacteria bacterium]
MKKPTFSAVVPVVNRKMANRLFASIDDNLYGPEKVIVIDNTRGHKRLEMKASFSNVLMLKPSEPLPVNPSWEIGIRLSGDVNFVSILNDDVILGPGFFEWVACVFERYADAGAVCPHTLTPENSEIPEPGIHRMKRKEGWAFTMRKALLDQIPPIPEGCRYFFGDNWFWWFTYRKFNMLWYKDTGNVIWHEVGASVRKIDGYRRIKEKEKEVCSRALRGYFPGSKKEAKR